VAVTLVTPTISGREPLLIELARDVAAQTKPPKRWLIGFDYECRGPGRIRNLLALTADTEWLAFVDDDDRISPNHLETLVGAARPEDSVVYTLGEVEGRNWQIPHDCTHGLRYNTIPMTTLVRSTAFREVEGFDDEHQEDFSLWRRIRQRGGIFHCVHSVTWTYRFHGDNRSMRDGN
jgi:glycosyltransferase involved in cell wall biosynthesis